MRWRADPSLGIGSRRLRRIIGRVPPLQTSLLPDRPPLLHPRVPRRLLGYHKVGVTRRPEPAPVAERGVTHPPPERRGPPRLNPLLQCPSPARSTLILPTFDVSNVTNNFILDFRCLIHFCATYQSGSSSFTRIFKPRCQNRRWDFCFICPCSRRRSQNLIIDYAKRTIAQV
jgi:hypothetical protein